MGCACVCVCWGEWGGENREDREAGVCMRELEGGRRARRQTPPHRPWPGVETLRTAHLRGRSAFCFSANCGIYGQRGSNLKMHGGAGLGAHKRVTKAGRPSLPVSGTRDFPLCAAVLLAGSTNRLRRTHRCQQLLDGGIQLVGLSAAEGDANGGLSHMQHQLCGPCRQHQCVQAGC
jgi:hypothetical protein